MMSGIPYKQGDILIVPFPFSDLSGTKQRPVLVLSKEEYNATSLDVVTCGITSNLHERHYGVIIMQEDIIEGKIPKISIIKVDKLFTLEKTIVKKRVGRIRKETWEKVKKKFLELI